MNNTLSEKLKKLPISSGVYFHKSKSGEIIYVGKAAVLKNRVRQYFQSSRHFDVKTRSLVAEIYDVDWLETDSEIDALFLEAEMVKRYMPRYNILLRDDKSLTYIRIDMKNEWPHVSFTRNPADDDADYFGPYFNSFAVKKALRYLRRVFPYYIKPTKYTDRKDLYSHLGLSPTSMSSEEYKLNLKKLINYLKGGRKKIIVELEKEMKVAATNHDFELAAKIRNKVRNLTELQNRIMFGDKEFLDISKDVALSDLSKLLGLDKDLSRIEGFDVSHMSGTNVVASMVVFKNGVSDRAEYRKFKTKNDVNDDFLNMNETILRRLSQKNLKNWGTPDLVLIDGGKGQLDAATRARDSLGLNELIFIGLAKREEKIVVKNSDGFNIDKQKIVALDGSLEISDDFTLIDLPNSSHIVKLLQRIRDESHRFAVSYHSTLKKNKQTTSILDEIPGIGPKTRSKLIRKFGSISGLKMADEIEIQKIIGLSKTKLVVNYIKEL